MKKMAVTFMHTVFDVYVDPDKPYEYEAYYNGMNVNGLFFDMRLSDGLLQEILKKLGNKSE